jgi:hypothetical protein
MLEVLSELTPEHITKQMLELQKPCSAHMMYKLVFSYPLSVREIMDPPHVTQVRFILRQGGQVLQADQQHNMAAADNLTKAARHAVTTHGHEVLTCYSFKYVAHRRKPRALKHKVNNLIHQ